MNYVMRLSRSMTIRRKPPQIERFTMGTSNRSFQLEQTFPGVFLLQGWFGGVLAALVYVVAMCVWDEYVRLSDALSLTLFMVYWISILGLIKATIMWAPYRLARVQPHALTRVAIASTATGLFALATAYLFGTGRPNDVFAWTLTLLLGGLPTAILIGSNVKPWELFTFGSIGGERPQSVWRTFATLPLRFLSLGAAAVWVMMFACERGIDKSDFNVIAGFAVPLIYLLFSAYLTFRSPRKTILLVLGVVLNLPIVFFAYPNYPYRAVLFIAAWIVFLAARLSVRTHPVFITDLSEALLRAHEARSHDCLGSRFVEWRQRVA